MTLKNDTCLPVESIILILLDRSVNFNCFKRGGTQVTTLAINLNYSDWVCSAVMSNDVMKDLRG